MSTDRRMPETIPSKCLGRRMALIQTRTAERLLGVVAPYVAVRATFRPPAFGSEHPKRLPVVPPWPE